MPLRYWIPSLIWAAAVFSLSHMSHPPGTSLGPDYVLHFLEFGVFGATLVWGMTAGLKRELPLDKAVLAWLIAAVYAAADEVHQSFVPGRVSSFEDFVADAAGAAVLIAGGYGLLRWRERRHR